MTHPESREALENMKKLLERDRNIAGNEQPPNDVEGSQSGNTNNFPE
jgi:hypothetical protein